MVDAATLHALDIFREERHPSNMGIGSTKEGFSLFGLLQRCVTQMVSALGDKKHWHGIHLRCPQLSWHDTLNVL